MSEILLSIRPQYVSKIFDGSKRYEFRRKRCKAEVERIIIYETTPMKKIVGEACVSRILEKTPEDLWKETQKYAGVDKETFFSYFENCTVAYGYEIKNVRQYSIPKLLSDYGVQAPPQSFVYLS